MLVPHDPHLDPRVLWAADLCARHARTDLIGAVDATDRPWREYDGRLCTERMNANAHASPWAKLLARVGGKAQWSGPAQRCLTEKVRQLELGRPPVSSLNGFVGLCRKVDRAIGEIALCIGKVLRVHRLLSAMRRRARAVSVVPDLVVCHDLHALIAGVLLKRMHGCPILYDAHEFWPASDMTAGRLERWYWSRLEHRYARQADAVITVSPQLGEHMRSCYGLKRVVSVANAMPRINVDNPAHLRRPAHPVRFLFQGGAAHGRGLERLLATWERWADSRTVLYMRAPEAPLLDELRRRHVAAVARRTIVFLPPVPEEEMVEAATFADVGLIPYPPTNINHRYCCPNKLSQYMQAGLAVLAADTVFVRERLSEYDCGLVYHHDRPDTLIEQATRLRDDAALLSRLKTNAHRFAQSTYNWERVSTPYRELIEGFLHRRGRTAGRKVA
jgi:glycosyltransferase involved in cell wall biosynthesis